MSAPLLSRFDLLFVLLDSPDEQRDQRLSEHILSLHSKPDGSREASRPTSAIRTNEMIGVAFLIVTDLRTTTARVARGGDEQDDSSHDLLSRLLRTPEEPSAIPA